ncbi:MAG: thioredoxin domain-containing protein [Candidatus Peregrinibacteria bacterium]
MADSSQQSDTKMWFGIAMVLIGIIVGFTAAKMTSIPIKAPTAIAPTAQQPTPPAAPPADTAPAYADILPVDSQTDHIRGDVNAPITIIEYSDLECPFCARVHPTIEQIIKDNSGKVNWVFRHFPLPPQMHPNAQKAAEATECATELGGNTKFWEMTDMIYAKGADIAQLATYAKAIGLKEAAFKTCLDSGKFASKISDMEQSGSKVGISGTPGNIIVNHETKQVKEVSGAQPVANFQTAIDALLAK